MRLFEQYPEAVDEEKATSNRFEQRSVTLADSGEDLSRRRQHTERKATKLAELRTLKARYPDSPYAKNADNRALVPLTAGLIVILWMVWIDPPASGHKTSALAHGAGGAGDQHATTVAGERALALAS